MTVKQVARQVLDRAPEDCSWEELMNELRLQQELEISHAESERGEGTPLEDVVEKIPQWIENATK